MPPCAAPADRPGAVAVRTSDGPRAARISGAPMASPATMRASRSARTSAGIVGDEISTNAFQDSRR